MILGAQDGEGECRSVGLGWKAGRAQILEILVGTAKKLEIYLFRQ
jgi:hypothetical protein